MRKSDETLRALASTAISSTVIDFRTPASIFAIVLLVKEFAPARAHSSANRRADHRRSLRRALMRLATCVVTDTWFM
jgi:hypothetical protein